jgi:hypothetical protein
VNDKQRLIKEIEQAPDFLVKEVLDFLLSSKNKRKYLKFSHNRNSEKSLKSLLLAIPNIGEDSDFERLSDLGRDIERSMKRYLNNYLIREQKQFLKLHQL